MRGKKTRSRGTIRGSEERILQGEEQKEDVFEGREAHGISHFKGWVYGEG